MVCECMLEKYFFGIRILFKRHMVKCVSSTFPSHKFPLKIQNTFWKLSVFVYLIYLSISDNLLLMYLFVESLGFKNVFIYICHYR